MVLLMQIALDLTNLGTTGTIPISLCYGIIMLWNACIVFGSPPWLSIAEQ